MTQLSYVQTLRNVRNPHWHEKLEASRRFDAKYTSVMDRFDAAQGGYTILDLGVKVRITGEHTSVLVPWTAISYAEEAPEETHQPESTETTVAATPRAKRGGTK